MSGWELSSTVSFRIITLAFSVIDKYIIISRAETLHTCSTDSLPPEEIKYITGVIVDEESFEPLPFATIRIKK